MASIFLWTTLEAGDDYTYPEKAFFLGCTNSDNVMLTYAGSHGGWPSAACSS